MADKVAAAFHEVYNKVPRSVRRSGKTGEAKRAMMTAIALSKARAAGARIPKKGGNTNLAANSLKYHALEGRRQNLADKAKFKSGPICGD